MPVNLRDCLLAPRPRCVRSQNSRRIVRDDMCTKIQFAMLPCRLVWNLKIDWVVEENGFHGSIVRVHVSGYRDRDLGLALPAPAPMALTPACQATDQCTPEACACANSRTHVKYNASTVDGASSCNVSLNRKTSCKQCLRMQAVCYFPDSSINKENTSRERERNL